MHKKYVGITVGPIFDTILDASSPAALWFASYLFSDITKRLCEKITEPGRFGDVVIYTPYYDADISLLDGVGKFHDRVIFATENYSKETLDQIIAEVKEETMYALPMDLLEMQDDQTKHFLKEYLQIHYVVKEDIGNENCILALSPYLDALELMKTFPKDDAVNPIRKLFAGAVKNKNVWLKESPLYKQVGQHQMKKADDRIISIEEIAAGQTTDALKRKNYYAVVSADGDNMGKVLQTLLTDAEITSFSKDCLTYAEEAAKQIHAFGGVTIYAGGDDLLFLAPVMNQDKTILDLCHEIQETFQSIFAGKYGDTNASVSFGVAVQYAKYPLYEALNSARKQLALAKCDGDFENKHPKKNNVVLELQKHSGQSIALCISNECHAKVSDVLAIGKNQDETKNEEQTLHSVLYTLDTFSSLVAIMDQNARQNPEDYDKYEKAWDNLFDNAGQEAAKSYINAICERYFRHFVTAEEQGVSAVGDASSLRTLLYILRLKKFLVEKNPILSVRRICQSRPPF